MRIAGFAACDLDGAARGDIGSGCLRHVLQQKPSRFLAYMTGLVFLASFALYTTTDTTLPPAGLCRLQASSREGNSTDITREVLEILARERSIEGREGQMLLQTELMSVPDTLLKAMLARNAQWLRIVQAAQSARSCANTYLPM